MSIQTLERTRDEQLIASYPNFSRISPADSSRQQEISNFMKTWRKTRDAQFAEELASYKLETDRVPDPYRFVADTEGDLYSPTANLKIRDSIFRGNYIGQMEGEAFDKINDWFKTNEKGVVIWLSPKYEGVYEDVKIVVSEIQGKGKEKSLFNRAIIFDFDNKQTLEFANKLAEFAKNYPLISSLGQIRTTPFILAATDWISTIEEIVPDPELWNMVRIGEDLRKKQEALLQARNLRQDMFKTDIYGTKPDPYLIQMQMTQMLGNRSTSCPITFGKDTAFQVFAKSSYYPAGNFIGGYPLTSFSQEKEKWDYHRGDCRVCESKNLEVGPCEICKTCEKTFD